MWPFSRGRCRTDPAIESLFRSVCERPSEGDTADPSPHANQLVNTTFYCHGECRDRTARNEQVRGSIPRPGSARKHGLTRQDAQMTVQGRRHHDDDLGKRDTLVTQEPKSRRSHRRVAVGASGGSCPSVPSDITCDHGTPPAAVTARVMPSNVCSRSSDVVNHQCRHPRPAHDQPEAHQRRGPPPRRRISRHVAEVELRLRAMGGLDRCRRRLRRANGSEATSGP